MEKLFGQFKEIFLESAPQIGPEHWQFDAYGLEHIGYMERTYTYELYSKMRKVQDQKQYKYFTIHGEPEKARTTFFKSIIERLEDLKKEGEEDVDFQKRAMPDFLVHIPYDVNSNIAIVEVKPDKGRVTKEFKKDIRVIKEFIDGGDGAMGYHAGISLLFNTIDGIKEPGGVEKEYSRGIKEILGENAQNYTKKLFLFYHPGPYKDFIELDWNK